MITEEPLISQILDMLAGGFLCLFSASLASHFGYRSSDRLPGESRMPHCSFCYRPLQWFEFFPLFGWLLRRNPTALPCPCGKKKRLWPLPVTELIGFLMGIAVVCLAGLSWDTVPLCLGLGLLPAIAFIDLVFGIIPDELNILLGLFGLVWLWVSGGDIFLNLIGLAGLMGLGLFLAVGYSKWRGREMLGLGDVKFFAAAGLWLSLIVIPWFLFSAGVIGVLVGYLWRRAGGGAVFPFGPALCIALAGCIYYQVYVIYWMNPL